jgi:chromosome segregation ATPase
MKQKQKRQGVPEKAVIESDNVTHSTVSMTSGTQAALEAMRQSVLTLQAEKQKNDQKIASMDGTIEQIAREVTKLSETQRKANNDYVQIKEQILNIAKDSGEMKTEMMEMKSMIMSIAHHLGGVITDSDTEPTEGNTKKSSQTHPQYPYDSTSIPFTKSQESASMSDIEISESFDKKPTQVQDVNRKKLKHTHTQVFNTQATPEPPTQRANHPPLLPKAVDSSNGSDKNLSMSDEDIASMYD